MKQRCIFLFAATAFLLAACTAQTPTDEQSTVATQEVQNNEQVVKPEVATTPVPNGKSILADIYKQSVGEITGSQLSDGRYVSYWNGHQFTLDGKNYFVAFSEATPESEIEYPAPEDMVTISQATYEFENNAWKLKAVQHDIGKFGGKNQSPAVNTDQKNATFQNPDGNFMIATPSVTSAMSGTQLFSYEIFAYAPKDSTWKYLGGVEAGYDNSAGCSHEIDSATTIKCVRRAGKLQFTATENSAWPEIKITLQETKLGEDGNVITLTDKNSITYRYDDKSSNYLPIKKI